MSNPLIHFLAALVPLIVGFIWYTPKLFGNLWMREARVTEDMIKGGNMPLIFILSYVFAFMLTMIMAYFVDHSAQIEGLFRPIAEHGYGLEPAGSTADLIREKVTAYDARFGTFGHGAFHGLLLSFVLILPVLATNAMFERKSFKYIMVNFGYWALTFTLMGAVLGKWA